MGAISPRDAHHEAARRVFERIADGEWRAVHTSDYVVAEALNFARVKLKRREAVQAVLAPVFGREGAPPAVTSVLRVHAGRFASALERFHRDFDHGLSFTDCTSLAVMEDEGIHRLATFDKGFTPFVETVEG